MASEQKTERTAWSVLREYAAPLIWALVLAALLRASVVQASFVPSGSMEPTLLPGDHLLVDRTAYGVKLPFSDLVLLPLGDPARGDVVVFANPTGHGDDYVKRIVGLPGETVRVADGKVFINGQAIRDPWGHPTAMSSVPDFGPVTVPPDSYFMMGDNRDHSYDSRFWNQGRGGFVPRGDIKGKVRVVLWSWNNFPTDLRWSRSGTLIK